MIILTTDDILAAAAYAVQHPDTYDQRIWCGSACCVLGHARRLAGQPVLNQGLRDGEYPESSPRADALRAMLLWTHADTAALMAHVQADGTVLVPPGGVGAFGAGAVIGEGAVIDAWAVIGEGAVIGAGAVIGEGAVIDDWAVIEKEAIV